MLTEAELQKIERKYGPGCVIPVDIHSTQGMADATRALIAEVRRLRALVSIAGPLVGSGFGAGSAESQRESLLNVKLQSDGTFKKQT